MTTTREAALEEGEPHVWTWQSCENSQGWNTKYGDTPPEPGPWISDIQPLYLHPAKPAPDNVGVPDDGAFKDGWGFAYRQWQRTGSVPDPAHVLSIAKPIPGEKT